MFNPTLRHTNRLHLISVCVRLCVGYEGLTQVDSLVCGIFFVIIGVEILQWLSDHPTDVYCVVDDEIVDIEPYIDKDKIVKTDMRYGLSLSDAKRIIEKLNEGDKTNEI